MSRKYFKRNGRRTRLTDIRHCLCEFAGPKTQVLRDVAFQVFEEVSVRHIPVIASLAPADRFCGRGD
jgi:hypothetical protein